MLKPVLVAAAGVVGGCVSGPTGESLSGPGWTRASPLGQVRPAAVTLGAERTGSALPPIDPSALMLAASQTFGEWDAGAAGTRTMVVEPVTDQAEPGRWRVRRLVGVRGEMRPDSEQTYVKTDDGSIALAEEVQHGEGVEVIFEPPLLVIPAGLIAGAPRVEQSVRMTVHPMGDRSRTRASGPAENRITYEADQSVTSPRGEFIARRLAYALTAELGPARVINRSVAWYVDGLGLIAQRDQEMTTVLGLPSRNNRAAWISTPR